MFAISARSTRTNIARGAALAALVVGLTLLTGCGSKKADNASATTTTSANTGSTTQASSASTSTTLVSDASVAPLSEPDGSTGFVEVAIARFSFPENIHIAAGSAIRWTNTDSSVHTVTSTDTSPGLAFDSGDLNKDQKFDIAFTASGTYVYRCTIHSAMRGTITVD